MPLNLKTFNDFYNSIIGKFVTELPDVDPTIDASLEKTLAVTSAIVASNLQDGIEDAVDQMFWQTSDDDFLKKIGEYNKIYINNAEAAIGYCSVEGIIDKIVKENEILIGTNGLSYKVIVDASVNNYQGSLSLSYSGGIVTAITDSEHTLATGLNVTISGAAQTEYNGTYVITVLGKNTFQYEIIAGSLTSDLADYSSIYASLYVESLTAGAISNIEPGGNLKINIDDINDTAYVQFEGIDGGSDIESIDDFRVRTGEANQLTPGIATVPSLIYSAKKISGNTRIFVIRGDPSPSGSPGSAGYIPALGQTVIYVLRDNDVSITPSQTILDDTKQQIINDGNWPTLTTTENLFILAPIISQEDFEITDLIPNTVTMQNAINNRLVDFFRDNANTSKNGNTILLVDIKSFIRTITDSTGARLISFTLNNPSVDIIADSGEIYIKGVVSFV